MSSVFGNEYSNQPSSVDYLDAYESSFLVHACVRKIAEKVANTNFRLYRAGKKITEVSDSPILDLLANPNGRMTQFDLIDIVSTGLELTGNAYLYKIRSKNSKKISELWPLRPDWVEVVSENNLITNYKYTNNGKIESFNPDDVIHFKTINPKSSIYGLSVVKPALEIIKNLIFANRWNMNFFYNSARPDFFILSKSQLDSEQKKEFDKQWDEKFRGVSKSHKYALLEGDAEIKPMSFTMKDMEFSTLTEAMINQILAAFGVPKSIIGFQGMNRAEAEAQIYVFLSETIEPKVRRITDSFNQFLISEFGDSFYLDYDDPSPENREALTLEYASALQHNWMLINEVRDLEGMAPIEGGWDFYLPLSMIPAGGGVPQKAVKAGGINPKKYYEEKEKKEQLFLRKKMLAGKRTFKLKEQLKKDLIKYYKLKEKKIKKNIKKTLNFTSEQKIAFWKDHDKRLTSDIKEFKILSEKLFSSQRKRALEALKDNFKDFTKDKFDLLKWEAEEEIFKSASKPVYTDIIKRRGTSAAVLLGTDFNMTDKILKFIDKKASIFSSEVNKTTLDKIRRELKEGIANEEGIPELAKRIDSIYDSREGPGSETIARTEVIGATGEADLEAFKQSEVVETKIWLATPDERTRDSHLDVDGEEIELNERFSNGLMFPGDSAGGVDEVVNCRCVLLPGIK